jgi:hypothetical protein
MNARKRTIPMLPERRTALSAALRAVSINI